MCEQQLAQDSHAAAWSSGHPPPVVRVFCLTWRATNLTWNDVSHEPRSTRSDTARASHATCGQRTPTANPHEVAWRTTVRLAGRRMHRGGRFGLGQRSSRSSVDKSGARPARAARRAKPMMAPWHGEQGTIGASRGKGPGDASDWPLFECSKAVLMGWDCDTQTVVSGGVRRPRRRWRDPFETRALGNPMRGPEEDGLDNGPSTKGRVRFRRAPRCWVALAAGVLGWDGEPCLTRPYCCPLCPGGVGLAMDGGWCVIRSGGGDCVGMETRLEPSRFHRQFCYVQLSRRPRRRCWRRASGAHALVRNWRRAGPRCSRVSQPSGQTSWKEVSINGPDQTTRSVAPMDGLLTPALGHNSRALAPQQSQASSARQRGHPNAPSCGHTSTVSRARGRCAKWGHGGSTRDLRSPAKTNCRANAATDRRRQVTCDRVRMRPVSTTPLCGGCSAPLRRSFNQCARRWVVCPSLTDHTMIVGNVLDKVSAWLTAPLDAPATSVVLESPSDRLLTTHSTACWSSTVDPSWVYHDGSCTGPRQAGLAWDATLPFSSIYHDCWGPPTFVQQWTSTAGWSVSTEVYSTVQYCRFALDDPDPAWILPDLPSTRAGVNGRGMSGHGTGAGNLVNGLTPRRLTHAWESRPTRSGGPRGRTRHHAAMAFLEEYSRSLKNIILKLQPFSEKSCTPTVAK